MKTCNVIPAKAGIQSFAALWMPRHAHEGGDCAGMTILAAVMINSRLDRMRFGSGFDVLRQAQHADKLSVPNL